MLRNLLTAATLLTMLSTGIAGDQIVKDGFQDQAEGQMLSDLVNWKFYGGWVKPEDGKILADGSNKFLRFHGDFFARKQVALTDKLTFRFKIRADGTDDEIGGLDLRAADGKQRYDVIFGFKHGGVTLNKDGAGQRETLGKKENILNGGFQTVEVIVERLGGSVQFTVSVNGTKVIEKEDPQEMSFLRENFNVGFFTYNQKTIEIDDVEFTSGK